MHMKKIVGWVVLLIAVGIAGFFALNTYIYNEKQGSELAQKVQDLTFFISGETIDFENGVATAKTSLGGESETTIRYFGNEIEHDVDGDGVDDIVFLITQETGGSGTFFYAVGALKRDDGYIGTHALYIGDRIAPQTITPGEGRQVVVNYADRLPAQAGAPGEPMTAQPSVGKSLYLLLDTEDLQFGEVVQGFEGDGELCAQVLTDARNPQTGEIQTFPTPCAVPEGWDTLETDQEAFMRNGETWSRYRNDDLGIRFEYRVDPNGYVLIDQRDNYRGYDNSALVEAVSLFDKKEYAELLASTEPREGPPSITVLVFDNPSRHEPLEWVEANRLFSNIALATSEIKTIQFSGNTAVRYTADGLYTNDIIVAENNGRIYLISGSYSEEDSPIRRDFINMLQYFSLY